MSDVKILSVNWVLHDIISYFKAIKYTAGFENQMNEFNNRLELWQHLFT
mgnify:CR=1 FL=1